MQVRLEAEVRDFQNLPAPISGLEEYCKDSTNRSYSGQSMSDSVPGGSWMDYTECIEPQPQFTPTHQCLQLISMIMVAKFKSNAPDKIRNAIAQVSTSCPSVSNCKITQLNCSPLQAIGYFAATDCGKTIQE